jgi:hypothetical protein
MGFKRLEADDFVVSAQAQTSTVWSGNSPTLTTFFTQSNQVQSVSGKYYTVVYNAESGSSREAQFEIAYGNSTGGGGLAFNSNVNNYSPTTTIYGSYRTLVLEDENASFIFGDTTGSSIYALSIERARYKESLFPGSLNLTLKNGSEVVVLSDNSKDVTVPTYYGSMRAYQIVSGSNGSAFSGTGYSVSGSYGLFLPDIGTILLNGDALDLGASNGGISLGTNKTVNTEGNNNQKLFNAIVDGVGSAPTTSSFGLNSEETITSDFVFVRARNSEFNYSENPSYISGSTGEVIYNYFINNPQTYITTVGLYNDSNELLATAKLSKPLNKDFTKEALVRVKLDF